MTKSHKGRVLTFVLVIFGIIFVQNALTENVSAARILNSSTSTSNLKLYKSSDGQIVERETVECGARSYFSFDFLIESETPFAAGDMAHIKVNQSTSFNHSGETLITTSTYNIVKDSKVVATWQAVSGGYIDIVITEDGAGLQSLSGNIMTGNILRQSTCLDHEINHVYKIGWHVDDLDDLKEVATTSYTIPRIAVGGANNQAPAIGVTGFSETVMTYSIHSSSSVQNALYKTTPEPLTESQKITDELLKITLPSTVSEITSFSVNARITFPKNWDLTGKSGAGNYATSISVPKCTSSRVTKCLRQVNQEEGDSEDDFIAKIKQQPLSYGTFASSTGGNSQKVFYIYYGNLPSDDITYDDLLSSQDFATRINNNSNYLKETKQALVKLNGNNNSVNGRLTFYQGSLSVKLQEGALSDGSVVDTTLSYWYKDGTNTQQANSIPARATLSMGKSSDAVTRGTAALTLVDKDTLIKISDASFKLQRLDGSTWVDTEKQPSSSTASNGTLQVIGLDPGQYRWVQTGFKEGYKNTTSYYDDQNYTSDHLIESFTLGDEGFMTYVTNERQDVTITFEGGKHASSSFTNIVRNIKYGDQIQIPSSDSITGQTGWVFSSWDRNVPAIATQSESFVAQWTREKVVVRVKLQWADGLDYDGLRPALNDLSLKLSIDGHQTGYSASFDENSIAIIRDLDKYDDNGELNNWQPLVTEANGFVQNYAFTTEDQSTELHELNFVTTGTHTPVTRISICKDWDDEDDAEQLRPSNFSFSILTSNTIVSTVNFDGTNRCEYSEELPIFSNLQDGTRYNFELREFESAIYDAEIAIEPNSAFSYIVTNHLKTPEPLSFNFQVDASVDSDAEDEDELTTLTLSPKTDNEPVPAGADDNREVTVAITEDGVDFGNVEFTKAGDYTYTISLNTPDATSGDENGNSEFTVVVQVVRNEDNQLVTQSIRYFDADGNEVDPSEVGFNVVHLAPEPLTVDSSFNIPTEGDLYDDALLATVTPITEGAPMPGDADSVAVYVDPDGNVNLGEITFTEPGTFDYRLELDSDVYDLDETEFIVRVITSVNKETNQIQIDDVILCDKDGNPIDLASFKLKLELKEAELPENPNTGDSAAAILIASTALLGLSAGLMIARKRR